MTKVYYVDTAIPSDKKRKGEEKTHAVFDGNRVSRVKKLTKLEDATEIYVDVIFPQNYEEIMKLIERGIKVFILRNTRLLKRLREEDKIKKSDEADAQLLSRIPRTFFRELTFREVKLLQLINEYEKYAKWKEIVKIWITKSCSSDPFKECVRKLRLIRDSYARRIVKEVIKDEKYAPIYTMVCKELGLRYSVDVAILVVRLPLNRKLSRLKGLLGLVPHKSKNYHHKLRTHLTRVAATIYLHSKRFNKTELKILENIEGLPYRKALYMLQKRILKILKRAWQQRQCMLAGRQ